jgi:hypothetical protein
MLRNEVPGDHRRRGEGPVRTSRPGSCQRSRTGHRCRRLPRHPANEEHPRDTHRDPPTPTGPASRHRWWIITAAAAAVVLITGGAGVLAARDDPTEPTTTAPTTTGPTTTGQETPEPGAAQIARGFVDAYGAFDADRVKTYLSDDAVFLGFSRVLPRTPEERRLAISMLEAVGYKQSVVGCGRPDRSVSAAGTRIRCTFGFHALRSDEIAQVRTEFGGSERVGVGPYSGSYFDLIVRDGEIVQAGLHLATGEFFPQVWKPFESWVTREYPEDLGRDVRAAAGGSGRPGGRGPHGAHLVAAQRGIDPALGAGTAGSGSPPATPTPTSGE